MVFVDGILHYVVVSEHVHSLHQGAPSGISVGAGPGGIQAVRFLAHQPRQFFTFGAVLDRPFLVPYAPEYYGRVVEVAGYHLLKLVVLLVDAHLAVLVNYQHSKLVADVQHRGRCGIVRTAYGVESVFF